MGYSGSSPTWTTTPDRTSVAACITAASARDTVNVSAGTATWASALTVSKSINLIGAGIGNTVITRGGTHILRYQPADYTLNQAFRLSSFSFNGAAGDILKLGEDLWTVDPSDPPDAPENTNIRVDHNRFYSSSACSLNSIAIEHFGQIFGVVDNNTIDNYVYPMRNQSPAGFAQLWTPAINGTAGFHLLVPGSIYNLYFEDNTINLALSGGEAAMTNSQYSGRYAYRYNQINFPAGGQSWYLFDVHGYQGSEMHSPFGSENYGNRLVTNGSDIGYVNIRGGINLIHHNSSTTAVTYGTSGSVTSCPAAPYNQYEPVNKSYFFRNRTAYTGSLATANFDGDGAYSCGGHTRPTEGIDFFNDVDSSPLTTCGPLASRPASPVVGQGYWATDQSTTNLTNMVGIAPSTPISGTLYICLSAGTWTSFYTPLAYPHPLRSGSVSPPIGTPVLSVR